MVNIFLSLALLSFGLMQAMDHPQPDDSQKQITAADSDLQANQSGQGSTQSISPSPDDECPICFCDIRVNNPEPFQCEHVICYSCQQNPKYKKLDALCPLCRKPVRDVRPVQIAADAEFARREIAREQVERTRIEVEYILRGREEVRRNAINTIAQIIPIAIAVWMLMGGSN